MLFDIWHVPKSTASQMAHTERAGNKQGKPNQKKKNKEKKQQQQQRKSRIMGAI